MKTYHGEHEYTLKTEPPEAMYWETRKIKFEEIICADEEVRQAIYEDLESERKYLKSLKEGK